MKEFFTNLFDETFSDGLGEGTFGYRHIIWILATVALAIILYFVFKKYKRAGRIFCIVICCMTFFFRLPMTIRRMFTDYPNNFLTNIPWHMCSFLAFILPVVVVFNIKPLKTAVYSTSIMGGVITLALGDYFDSALINIYLLESMFTHMFMLILPLIEVATGRFTFEFKKSWQAVLGMLFFIGWASLANEIIFKGLGYSYMYLKYNALPFEIPGVHFFFMYIFIYIIFFLIMFGAPYLHRKLQARKIEVA